MVNSCGGKNVRGNSLLRNFNSASSIFVWDVSLINMHVTKINACGWCGVQCQLNHQQGVSEINIHLSNRQEITDRK